MLNSQHFVIRHFPIYIAAEREQKDDDEHEVALGDQGIKKQWRKAAKTITTQQQVNHSICISN